MRQTTETTRGIVATRQEPLRRRYRDAPGEAWIRDGARALRGDAPDPFHGTVVPNNNAGAPWSLGIHRALGGDHDLPNPGDVLCAALAGCLSSTAHMLADRLGIAIDALEVSVTAEVDVRGTLLVDPSVPVGFQKMTCDVSLRLGSEVEPARLRAWMQTVERCCVVLQTLEGGVDVRTDWRVETA